MTVKVNMKKLVIIVVLVLLPIGGVWWYMESAPERKAKAEIKMRIGYLQKLTLENRIIEETAKRADYNRQMAAAKKPLPPNSFVPVNPIVKDPNEY